MARLLYETWEGDVRVRTYYDDTTHEVSIERHQDVQNVIDMVSEVNADGAPTIDGLGKPVLEIPVNVAIEWAGKRGIPWEKLLYGNEYDNEFKLFAREYSRLRYENSKTVHTVQ